MLRNYKSFVFLASLILIIVAISTLVKVADANQSGHIIIAFGDSITAHNGYQPKLEAMYRGIGQSVAVPNYGVAGETTSGSVNRIDQPLSANPSASYILILEGANDVYNGISVNTTAHNLGVMIDKSNAYGITAVIGTLTPNPKGDVNDYNPSIVSQARGRGALLADHYGSSASRWDSLSDDGLHPNNSGYEVMARTWYNAIGQLKDLPEPEPEPEDETGSASETEDASETENASETESDSNNSGGGSSGPCFIATAAYGSPLETNVMLLRKFRDQYLLTNTIGKGFVNLYYTYSPPVADIIAQHNILKWLVRLSLLPLVGWSWLALQLGLMSTLILTIIGLVCGFTIVNAVVKRYSPKSKLIRTAPQQV